MNKRTPKQQDAVATRMMVHMTMAFLFALTIMYISKAYSSAGVVNGINAVNTGGKAMFIVGAVALVAGIVYTVIGKTKKWDFSERVLTGKIAVIWPLVYTVDMAILAFTYWDYEAFFSATYVGLAVFLALYIIYYVFSEDFLYAAVATVISLFSIYVASHFQAIIGSTIGGNTAWYGMVAKTIVGVILAVVGILYLICVFKIKADKGIYAKSSKRVMSKTALYWPCIGVGIIHILGSVAFILGYASYAMYAMSAFAIVYSITYFARILFKK